MIDQENNISATLAHCKSYGHISNCETNSASSEGHLTKAIPIKKPYTGYVATMSQGLKRSTNVGPIVPR